MLHKVVRIKGQEQPMMARSFKEQNGFKLYLCIWQDKTGHLCQVMLREETLELVVPPLCGQEALEKAAEAAEQEVTSVSTD